VLFLSGCDQQKDPFLTIYS
ncbi:hypothetical protein CP03DC29_0163B, partial [Chlamydia psittaci 03DC29]